MLVLTRIVVERPNDCTLAAVASWASLDIVQACETYDVMQRFRFVVGGRIPTAEFCRPATSTPGLALDVKCHGGTLRGTLVDTPMWHPIAE